MKGKYLTFWLRLGSTVGLWIVILSAILSGYELAFFFLIAGLGLAGLWEYCRMLQAHGIPTFRLTAMLCAAIFLSGSFWYQRSTGPTGGNDLELAVLVAFILIVFGRQIFDRNVGTNPLRAVAYTLFGLVYIPWLFNFLTKIVFLTPPTETGQATGQFYVLYLVMVTKFGDMGGYFFGFLLGRHPSVPHISPKKTWEGFAGALVGASVASWILYWWMPEKLTLFRTMDWVVLPLLLGVAGIIGDLAESVIKRSTETKDSSRWLPGIGGTLDLIDSLLFTAPLLYFWLRLSMGVGQ